MRLSILLGALVVAFVITLPALASDTSMSSDDFISVPGYDDNSADLQRGSDDALEDELDDFVEDVTVGEMHRSHVSEAVKGLLNAADRSGGIGVQVRELAREQEAVHNDITEKIGVVEGKSWVARFLFGSDYKTLGELRSAIVTSENGIAVLKKARDKASSSVQADLDAEIHELEEENANARAFIDDQEGKFSLFGWLVRLF
jgi:hypothetical protein